MKYTSSPCFYRVLLTNTCESLGELKKAIGNSRTAFFVLPNLHLDKSKVHVYFLSDIFTLNIIIDFQCM